MTYSMVATDYDNTVVMIGDEISERQRAALNRIRAQGIQLAIVSGRTTHGLTARLRANGIATDGLYLVGSNGAKAVRMDADELLFGHPLDRELAIRAATRMSELGAVVMVPEGPHMYIVDSQDHWLVAEEAESNDTDVVVLDDWSALPITPYKIIMGGEAAQMVEVEAAISAEFGGLAEVVFSASYLVEFTAKGVHKGEALVGLCGAIGVPLDEVVVIGDNHNDVFMFGLGGLSVAVANAVPELIEIADKVTASCRDDGVAKLLDELFPPAN